MVPERQPVHGHTMWPVRSTLAVSVDDTSPEVGRPRIPVLDGNAVLALLALIKLLVHLITAGNYGYFRDELYYIAASERLAFRKAGLRLRGLPAARGLGDRLRARHARRRPSRASAPTRPGRGRRRGARRAHGARTRGRPVSRSCGAARATRRRPKGSRRRGRSLTGPTRWLVGRSPGTGGTVAVGR